MSQVSDLIEEEVKRIVDEKITNYIYYISKQYDISQKLLLQDLEKMDLGELDSPKSQSDYDEGVPGQCRGVMRNGKRCTCAGKNNGYCKKHLSQKKVSRPTVIPSNAKQLIPHTHSFAECLFKPGCPACEKFKKSPSTEKLLIDL
jgi:hypothetical protein